MARTQKLTYSQVNALTRLQQGACYYLDIQRAKANGKTLDFLVTSGLASLSNDDRGSKVWSITDFGVSALSSGRVSIFK